jgi:hypothetical protein
MGMIKGNKKSNGGTDMDPQYIEIYTELRKTKQELMDKIQADSSSPLIKPFIEGELKDIEAALRKFEKGTFGACEVSGEMIPNNLLEIIPTLKSMEDCKTLQYVMNKSTV